MLSKLSKRTQAELSMVLVAFIWGATFVIVKNALNDIGPFLFLGIRFIAAFLILAIISFANIRQMTLSTVLYGSFLGLFLFIGYSFQTVGLKYTTASNAGFITGLSVVLVPIIYSLFNRVLPAAKTAAAVILAAVGIYLLSFPRGSLNLNYGDSLEFVCAFGFAFHIFFVSRYSHKFNAVAITGIQMLFVGILCLAIGLFFETVPKQLTPNVFYALLVTSFFASSIAYLLMNALQKYSTPTRFAIVLATEPVFAALAGYLWADEILSPRALGGAALILFSMLMAVLTKQNAKNQGTEPPG